MVFGVLCNEHPIRSIYIFINMLASYYIVALCQRKLVLKQNKVINSEIEKHNECYDIEQ